MFWTVVIFLAAAYLLANWAIRLLKVGGYSSKYVFITGCDRGFGRELAIRLDKMGFPVFAACLTEDGRRELHETCSSRLVTLSLNVADNDSIREAVVTVKQKLPHENSLWAVINNAGVSGEGAALEMLVPNDHLKACSVNLFGPIEVSRVFMPLLRKSKGRLILMTSIMGRCAATAGPYCISKFGLEAFGDVCRREVSRFGVKVSLIEPGYFRTGIVDVKRIKETTRDCYKRSDLEVQTAYGSDYVSKMELVLDTVYEHMSPDTYKVVDAYVAAITSVYPKTRYVIGYDANLVFVPLSYLPPCVLNWFLAKKQADIFKKHKNI